MSKNQRDHRPKAFLKPPEYPGGSKALNQFIKTHIRIPEEAIRQQVKGVVRLQLDVEFTGKITKVHVLQGLGFGCDEEAIRLAWMLVFLPAHNRNLRVGRRINLNIPFDGKAESFQITYDWVSDANSSEESDANPKDSNSGYGYTITLS